MCYHVSTGGKDERKRLIANDKRKIRKEWIQKFHVSGFTRPFMPVTLNSEPNIIDEAQWKLIPFWVKDEDGAKTYANTLNAESGEIFDKPSYKPYILKNRGLLWVDGFYEPHKVAGVKETDNYYIFKPSHEIFSIGIVWAPWENKDTGVVTNTFSVITTPANELLAEIHNEKKRMPLIITEENRNAWLAANSKEEIESFFIPAPDKYLDGHRIGMRVTGKGDFNVPEVQSSASNIDNGYGQLF